MGAPTAELEGALVERVLLFPRDAKRLANEVLDAIPDGVAKVGGRWVRIEQRPINQHVNGYRIVEV